VEGGTPVTVPTIETKRFTLRMFTQDDFEAYYERIFSARSVMRFLSGSGEPRTREESMLSFARFISPERDARDRVWAVVERDSNEVIGHGILQRLDMSDLIEVGYALGERWWGAGIATEASKALIEYGFTRTPLELIVGVAKPENAASRRVLEKSGLTYAGMRHYYKLDLAYYELSKADYTRRQNG
jgi:RimJ/RimL family protein N-acetyltransferase